MQDPAQPRELIPDPLRRAHMLLWTGVLPQAVLLALNLRSYGLVSGEMDAEQLHRHEADQPQARHRDRWL